MFSSFSPAYYVITTPVFISLAVKWKIPITLWKDAGGLEKVVVIVQSLSHVQLFCDPMDYSPPGPSVHEILEVRILDWAAISFFRGSSWPRDKPTSPELAGGFFTTEPPGKQGKGLLLKPAKLTGMPHLGVGVVHGRAGRVWGHQR